MRTYAIWGASRPILAFLVIFTFVSLSMVVLYHSNIIVPIDHLYFVRGAHAAISDLAHM